jgi:hypothetical protein
MSTGSGRTAALANAPGALNRERDFTPAIYGSLLVTTLVALQARLGADPTFMAMSLAASVVVFWLTHAWASIVNRRLHQRIGWAEVVEIGVDESPLLLAAVIPGVLLALARLEVYSADTAENAALVASLIQLFLWGLAVGRRAHSRWSLAIAVATVDFLLGLAIAALKLTALH